MISENKKNPILSYLTGPSPKARPASFGPAASPLEPIQAWRCTPPWTRQSAAAAVSLACAPRRAASRAYLRRCTCTPRALPQLAPPPYMASRKAGTRRPSELCDTVELAAPIRSNGAPTNEVDAIRGSAMPIRVWRTSSRCWRCPEVPPWCEDRAADRRPPCTRVRCWGSWPSEASPTSGQADDFRSAYGFGLAEKPSRYGFNRNANTTHVT
jgi:hypothetical protein